VLGGAVFIIANVAMLAFFKGPTMVPTPKNPAEADWLAANDRAILGDVFGDRPRSALVGVWRARPFDWSVDAPELGDDQ
jgi:hypothetical protein